MADNFLYVSCFCLCVWDHVRMNPVMVWQKHAKQNALFFVAVLPNNRFIH